MSLGNMFLCPVVVVGVRCPVVVVGVRCPVPKMYQNVPKCPTQTHLAHLFCRIQSCGLRIVATTFSAHSCHLLEDQRIKEIKRKTLGSNRKIDIGVGQQNVSRRPTVQFSAGHRFSQTSLTVMCMYPKSH